MKLLLSIICYGFIYLKGSSIFAAAEKAAPYGLSNGRMGIGIAGEYAKIEADLKVRSPVSLGTFSSSQQQACKKVQVAPSFELGSTFINNYYLGFLLGWHYSNANTSSISPVRGAYYFSHRFNFKSYIDVFIKPGYKLTSKTMIYGLIGPSIANWSHTTDMFSFDETTQITRYIDKFRMERKTVGLGLGFGFEYLIKKKYALSAEYASYFHRSHTASKRINYTYLAPRTGDLIKIVQPSYSTFSIRLTYFFSLF